MGFPSTSHMSCAQSRRSGPQVPPPVAARRRSLGRCTAMGRAWRRTTRRRARRTTRSALPLRPSHVQRPRASASQTLRLRLGFGLVTRTRSYHRGNDDDDPDKLAIIVETTRIRTSSSMSTERTSWRLRSRMYGTGTLRCSRPTSGPGARRTRMQRRI